VNTTPQASQPTPKELVRREGRRRVFRIMAVAVLGPTIASAIYFAIIAPPEYKAVMEFTIRGRLQPAPDILSGLGLPGGGNATNDAYAVIDYLMSDKTVSLLRARYKFSEAYSRFTLDPTAYLAPNTPVEWVTRYWDHKLKAEYDPTQDVTTVSVIAYTPQDALKLAQGVLQASSDVVNVLNAKVQQGSLRQAVEQVAATKRDFDAAKERVTTLEGRVNALTYNTVALESEAQIAAIDSALAQLNVNLGTIVATYKADAPQTKAVQDQIAALTQARAVAKAKAMSAPGLTASQHDAEIQAAQNDMLFSEKSYLSAEANLVAAEPESQDKNFVVAFLPPHLPQQSDYWERFLYVIAVFVASVVLFGVAALSYSVVKDHIQ